MVFGIGEALSLGGSLIGAFGGKKGGGGTSVSGYPLLPQVMRTGIENEWWPDAMNVYRDLRDAPKARVATFNPADLFASPELSAVQMAADMKAGLIPQQDMIYANGRIMPVAQPAPLPGAVPNPAPAGNPGANAMDDLRKEMVARQWLMQNAGTNNARHMQNAVDLGTMPLTQFGDSILKYNTPFAPMGL